MNERIATVERNTKETDIFVCLSLDGGINEINTGIGFFDHMLNSFAVHSGFGLKVRVDGDLYVDCHHTIEDTGIVLGQAFAQAIGDKAGIARYGSFYVPMDEALAFASLDISGRPFLVFDAQFNEERCGDYDTCMTVEFLRAFAFNAGITLHVKGIYGDNSHHLTEAIYKAVAHALAQATEQKIDGVLSTKGVLC